MVLSKGGVGGGVLLDDCDVDWGGSAGLVDFLVCHIESSITAEKMSKRRASIEALDSQGKLVML